MGEFLAPLSLKEEWKLNSQVLTVLHWLSEVSRHQDHLQGWLIHRLPDPSSRDSDLVGLGPGLRMRISDEFPGDADAALSRDRA